MFHAYLSEFLGSLILMFAIVYTKNIYMISLVLLVLLFILGPISGGHLNPAVTVGLAMAKSFKKSDVMPYVLAQVLGSYAGILLVKHM